MHVDPDTLSDEKWACLVADMQYIRKREQERQREIITQQIQGLMGQH